MISLQREMVTIHPLLHHHIHLLPHLHILPLPQKLLLKHLPHTPRVHGTTPLLKLDIKFELPTYNCEVNVGILDNWVLLIEFLLQDSEHQRC